MFREEFRHLKQPELWGCMYYSAQYFVDAEFQPDWLWDVNHHNFNRNMASIGHPMVCLYVDDLIMRPATTEHWLSIKKHLDGKGENVYMPLLVDIHSIRVQNVQHRVAAEVRNSWVRISDPAQSEAKTFTWVEFLESVYAKCLGIWQICEDTPFYFPVDDGREGVKKWQIVQPELVDLQEPLT